MLIEPVASIRTSILRSACAALAPTTVAATIAKPIKSLRTLCMIVSFPLLLCFVCLQSEQTLGKPLARETT
jgi:hypothetical protein